MPDEALLFVQFVHIVCSIKKAKVLQSFLPREILVFEMGTTKVVRYSKKSKKS